MRRMSWQVVGREMLAHTESPDQLLEVTCKEQRRRLRRDFGPTVHIKQSVMTRTGSPVDDGYLPVEAITHSDVGDVVILTEVWGDIGGDIAGDIGPIIPHSPTSPPQH